MINYVTVRNDSFVDIQGSYPKEDIKNVMFHYEGKILPDNEMDELTKFLEETYTDTLFQGDTIYDEMDLNHRNSLVEFVKEEHYKEGKIDKIIKRVEELNDLLFKFDIDQLTRAQYTIYEKGHLFQWHPDEVFGYEVRNPNIIIPDGLRYRKLTLVIMLSNHEDYEGGEFLLQVPTGKEENIYSFKLTKGEAILFPSFLSHKVNPVTKGIRKSYICWFTGPRWR